MKQAIGVFDSGIGGLLVLESLKKQFKNDDFIYIGDQKNSPYGDKNKEQIIEYSQRIVRYFIKQNCKAIIIACNTSTAYALDYLKTLTTIPIIGVVEPTVKQIAKQKHKKILVLATKATVNSNVYLNALQSIDNDLIVYQQECSKLVPLIENGYSNLEMDQVLHEYLDQYQDIDAIVLGCTHYPLIKDKIKQIKPCQIYDSNEATSNYAFNVLEKASNDQIQNIVTYTTKDVNSANERIKLLNLSYEFIKLEEDKF